MAEKVISPGVFTNEIDQTFLPAAIADIGACVIGPTVKGPVLVPTEVTSYSDYQTKFGDSFKSGSSYYQYLTSHTAEQYLKNGNKLTVIRILAGSYSGASTTISSSTDPGVVGGGTPHSASVTIAAGYYGGEGVGGDSTTVSASVSMSFTPFGGTEVKFIITGSSDSSANYYAGDTLTNTATQIYLLSGSTVAKTAESASNTFNNTIATHKLGLSSSFIAGVIHFTASNHGHLGVQEANPSATNTPEHLYGASVGTGGKYINITGSAELGAITNLGGGLDFGGVFPTFKNVFKLHTLADGAVMNSRGPLGKDNLPDSGSKDNLRYEISSLNQKKGTFTLSIRRGNDTTKKKQTLESFTNINLDPISNNYIGKAVGTQYQDIQTDENGKPFLQLVGDHPPKSKYVRVEVLEQTADYLDENGTMKEDSGYSGSLPAFFSGSNSGSYGGTFTGGSDGDVVNPQLFYENIEENSSQGLDPSSDGADAGFNQYVQALDLISNQDDYDVNLILTPGIISSIHGGVASKVIDVCEDRQDCFAIIDPIEFNKNVVNATDEAKTRNSNYAAVYWPWVQLPDLQVGAPRWVPSSVALAGVYSFNDKVAHPWFAPAGLNRGTIDTALRTERKLTHADRDVLYDANVNPIATFPGQGVTVFGQKTLQKKASSLDRINVRRLLIKVKKFIASSSRFLVFEQNTAATRRRFLSIANPFLEQVQSQSGLNAFRVVMDETNNTPDTIDRNQLVGQLFLQPTRTAEFIVLDFTIQPTGAAFPE